MVNLVPAICPSCGGQLELDDNMKRAECKYCKNTIIVDEAIEKFKTDAKGDLRISGIKNLDQLIEESQKYYKVKDYENAIETCDKILEIDAFNNEAIEIKTKSLIDKWNSIDDRDKKFKYEEYKTTSLANKIRDNYNSLNKIVEANDSKEKVFNKIGMDNIKEIEDIITKLNKYEKRIIKFKSSTESFLVLGFICFFGLLLLIMLISGAVVSIK